VFATVRNLALSGRYAELLERDQLVQQKIPRGGAFYKFHEAPINFGPTFKVLRNEEEGYMEKRLPAYCDRILWHCKSERKPLINKSYFSGLGVKSSDHKPVAAVFQFEVALRRPGRAGQAVIAKKDDTAAEPHSRTYTLQQLLQVSSHFISDSHQPADTTVPHHAVHQNDGRLSQWCRRRMNRWFHWKSGPSFLAADPDRKLETKRQFWLTVKGMSVREVLGSSYKRLQVRFLGPDVSKVRYATLSELSSSMSQSSSMWLQTEEVLVWLNAKYESAIVDNTLLVVVKSYDTRRKKDYIGSASICLDTFMTEHHYCRQDAMNGSDPAWSFTVDLMRYGSQAGTLSGKLELFRMESGEQPSYRHLRRGSGGPFSSGNARKPRTSLT